MTQQVLGDLEGLKEQIRSQGKQKCDQILREAQAKAQEILAEAQQRAAKEKELILAEAQQRAQRQQKQLEISAELAERKEILAVKRELLEQAFAQALSAFSKLPQEEYQELIKAFLEETKDPACQQLVISADEERITPEFLAGLSKELDWPLELVREENPRLTKGGFLLRGEKVEIDCTIPTLLQLDRAQLESEVAQILFGDL
ncbi:MAG: hypothetical protein GX766_09975 [Firmicutes bacterium]|jgi:vacuolar-type H+-ATPase subunit E/Vma4|nr:hypothetical protein [Bacillota bacterium]HOB22516.1 V-type ATP synthase subunit E family protein [Bacillota bacterium]HQD39376.1 V-type ATP synthase subunit E family protein [Bacillota bacterium]